MSPPGALPSAPSIEALLAHREWVRGLARRLLGHDADVDDVEQLTWIAAMRQPRLAAETLRAYLARIVRNLVIDRARQRTRRASHERRAARPEATGSPAETVARAEAHRCVVEAVLGLDEPYRSTLLLRFFEDLPVREVARRLGCDVEAVRTRIRRGLERVRGRLGPRMDLTLAPLLVPVLLRRAGVAGMSLKNAAVVAAVLVGATGAGVVISARERAERPFARGSADNEPVEGSSAAAETARTPRNERLVVSLRGPDGPGRAGALLYRVDGAGGVVAEAATDADGTASFERRGDETWVIARPSGRPVAYVPVPAGATEAAIELAPGALLEGILLVDGAPPARPVELSLRWEGGRSLPTVVRNAVESLGLDPEGAARETGTDGTFRFDGLPATEGAWIAVPPDFVLATGGQVCRVSLPGPFVRLDALALPRLRGRVVFEGSGEGVPGALLHAAWTTGERSGHLAVTATPDGRFEFALPELSLTDVALAYADESAITAGQRSLGAVGRGLHDLGDLAVPALRAGLATLRVVDGDGRPVQGAVARAEAAGSSVRFEAREPQGATAVPAGFASRLSDPTGPDGLLRLEVCAAPYVARIRARGFEPVALTIGAAGEQTVLLARSATLSVRVETAAGDSAAGLVVVLSADRPLFADDAEAFQGEGYSQCSTSEDGGWYAWIPDEKGGVEVDGLPAEVPVSVSCLDTFGAVQASERIALGKGEARAITLRVASPARPVRGVVRDAAGAPVEGAEVVGWAGNDWTRVACGTTGADGAFALEGARTPDVHLLVLAAGFQPRPVTAATDRENAIRLDRGRTIRLRVSEDSGAPVREAEVRVEHEWLADFPRDFWCGAEVEPGMYEIDGLPAGDVTVVVRTRDRTERYRHDTRKTEGTLVLGSD